MSRFGASHGFSALNRDQRRSAHWFWNKFLDTKTKSIESHCSQPPICQARYSLTTQDADAPKIMQELMAEAFPTFSSKIPNTISQPVTARTP